MRGALFCATALLTCLPALPSVAAQERAVLRARLSTVPIDIAMQTTVAGSGSATAQLDGNTLTVRGAFAGLKTPATTAKIHVAPRAIRGPALFDLTATAATHGEVHGVLTLTASQRADLLAGRFYLQLHSEKAPEGNLWGWLLPDRAKLP